MMHWLDDPLRELNHDEMGHCDDCSKHYNLASRSDHCVEEGQCWEHCANPTEHYNEQWAEIETIINDTEV